MGRQKERTNKISKWRRQLSKKAKIKCRKIKEKAKICKKTSSGVSSRVLIRFLSGARNFIGIFAQDELAKLTISNYPSYFIVNLDSKNLPGSHWIAIGVFSRKLEIFDPLGFSIFSWPTIPCDLLHFLLKFATGRKITICKTIQSNKSTLCGFFCTFYVLARNYLSFRGIQSYFSSKLSLNDSILIKLFQ